jgi:hypothetical protein
MYRNNLSKNCVENEDGTTFENHLLEDYEWLSIADLDAVFSPVGTFISTLKAAEKLTSSLVITMVMSIILHAASETTLFL